MGIETRARVTLSLCCLLVAACGGPLPVDTNGQTESWNAATSPGTPKTMTMSAAGGKAPFPGVMRATARIMPLMLSSTTPATGAAGATAAGSAGATAAAAGAGAAGTAAATSSASAGASASAAGSGGSKASGGSAGSAGKRSFADNDGFNTYAAGSGGSAAGSTGSTGTASGAAGMSGSSAPASGAAGTTAATTGAAGVPATATSPATTGAAGMAAVAMINGSATFASSSSGVNLTVMVSGCVDGKEYPMHIHTGTSCDSVMTQMGHWDMTRGEGIPNLKCGGKQGATMTMRTSMDPTTAWSVGDGTATDVVGHVVVIHDADDPTQRIACGQILKN